MVLHSLEKGIDIKQLHLETPDLRESTPFSGMRDVPQEIRELWEDRAEKLGSIQGDPFNQLTYAAGIKLVIPERLSSLNYGHHAVDKVIELLGEIQRDERQNGTMDYKEYCAALANFKVVFPRQYQDYQINQALLQKHTSLLTTFADSERYRSLAKYRWRGCILDPASAEKPVVFDQRFLRTIQRDMVDYPKTDSKWTTAASSLRILFPKEFKKIRFTAEDWQQIRRAINYERGVDTVTAAVNLQIIAAQDIKFNDNGVEFVMPQGKLKTDKEFPEQRNF